MISSKFLLAPAAVFDASLPTDPAPRADPLTTVRVEYRVV